jgi:hypothetical protein
MSAATAAATAPADECNNHKRMRRMDITLATAATSTDAMASTSSSCRVFPPPPPLPCITDVPDEALSSIAEYLVLPSRALFALAMTRVMTKKSQASSPSSSTTCRAILGRPTYRPADGRRPLDRPPNDDDDEDDVFLFHGKEFSSSSSPSSNWTSLDFGELDPSLAGRLDDDDLRGVLSCVDAYRELGVLRLTGCVGISGAGLSGLMGSNVLERIDLCPLPNMAHRRRRVVVSRGVDDEDEEDDVEDGTSCLLDETIVLPILISLIDSPGGRRLRHVHLPKKFRCSKSSILDDFIERYDEYLEGCMGGDKCSRCRVGSWGDMDGGGNPWMFEKRDSPSYGLQNYTCHVCANHYCTENDCVSRCHACDRAYCTDCVVLVECAKTGAKVCDMCRGGEMGDGVGGGDRCEACVVDEDDDAVLSHAAAMVVTQS